MPDSAGISVGQTSSTSASNQASSSASATRTGQNAHLLSIFTDMYRNYIDQSTNNYQNIFGAYGNALTSTAQAANNIFGGYQNLNTQVQNQLTGSEQTARQDIADQYARAQGKTVASAVGRGLGNTTVLDSMQRGNLSDKQRADLALTNQMQQLRAGYTGQFGSAGLGALGQQMGIQGQLGGQLLGTLGGYRLAMPDYAPNETYSSSLAQSVGSSTNTTLGSNFSTQGPVVPTPGPANIPGVGSVPGVGGYQTILPFGLGSGNATGNPLNPAPGGQIPLTPGHGIGPLSSNPFG